MNEMRATARVAPDHPCLAGHFPGHPIVPAVVLLEHVERALARALGARVSLRALPGVKFLSPLAPGVDFEIVLAIDVATRSARFHCQAAGRDIAQGRLTYDHD